MIDEESQEDVEQYLTRGDDFWTEGVEFCRAVSYY